MLLRWTVRRQSCTRAKRSSNTIFDCDCEYDANHYQHPFPDSDTYSEPTSHVYGDIYSYPLTDYLTFPHNHEHPLTNGNAAAHQYLHAYSNLATYQHNHTHTHLNGDGYRGYPTTRLGYTQPGCSVNYSYKSAY